jgi:hypothetical protein
MGVTERRAVKELRRAATLLASAAVDRLLHDAHVLILEGASFRNPPPERRKSKKNAQHEATT